MQGPITKLEFEPALMGDNGVNTMIGKVAAIFADQTDRVLMDAIIREAKANGITELYVLNKDFILSAIREKMESEEGGMSVERLTERLENGVINVKYASQHETAIHRLVTIEDILGDEYDLDLVQKLIQAYREGRYIILKEPEQAGISRLRELAQADRDGRCVVLPCKLHGKVFFIENGCVKETEVDSFHNWTSGRWKISTHTDRMFDHWKGYEIDFSGIGKTVFLTRESAEAALKERQKDES